MSTTPKIRILIDVSGSQLTFSVNSYTIEDQFISFYDEKTKRNRKFGLSRVIEVIE